MPTARYWRLSGVETHSLGDLAISRLELRHAGARVDADAVLSSQATPKSGAIGHLGDGDFGTICTFDASDVHLPGFAIVWDLGEPRTVSALAAAGPDVSTMLVHGWLAYSADGQSWQDWGVFALPEYSGAGVLHDLALRWHGLINSLLIMPADGAHGSNAFSDRSLWGHALTAQGGAQISTARAMFGGASAAFNGSSAYIAAPGALAALMHQTPLTIEAFVWLSAAPPVPSGNADIYNHPIVGQTWSGVYGEQCVGFNKNRQLVVDLENGASGFVWTSSASAPAETWVHVAFVLTGSHIRGYLNGAKVLDVATTRLWSNNGRPIEIGRQYNSVQPQFKGFFAGHIDDLHIAQGVLYDQDFTPPAVAMPRYARPLRTRALRACQCDMLGPSVQVVGPRLLAGGVSIDREDGGRARVYGTVSVMGQPARRRVRLHDLQSGRLLRETVSGENGAYSFDWIRGDRRYYVLAHDHTEQHNAAIADLIVPEPMP